MASTCTREGLGWTSEETSWLKGFSKLVRGCPGRWLNAHGWRCLKEQRCAAEGLGLAPALAKLETDWVIQLKGFYDWHCAMKEQNLSSNILSPVPAP